MSSTAAVLEGVPRRSPAESDVGVAAEPTDELTFSASDWVRGRWNLLRGGGADCNPRRLVPSTPPSSALEKSRQEMHPGGLLGDCFASKRFAELVSPEALQHKLAILRGHHGSDFCRGPLADGKGVAVAPLVSCLTAPPLATGSLPPPPDFDPPMFRGATQEKH